MADLAAERAGAGFGFGSPESVLFELAKEKRQLESQLRDYEKERNALRAKVAAGQYGRSISSQMAAREHTRRLSELDSEMGRAQVALSRINQQAPNLAAEVAAAAANQRAQAQQRSQRGFERAETNFANSQSDRSVKAVAGEAGLGFGAAEIGTAVAPLEKSFRDSVKLNRPGVEGMMAMKGYGPGVIDEILNTPLAATFQQQAQAGDPAAWKTLGSLLEQTKAMEAANPTMGSAASTAVQRFASQHGNALAQKQLEQTRAPATVQGAATQPGGADASTYVGKQAVPATPANPGAGTAAIPSGNANPNAQPGIPGPDIRPVQPGGPNLTPRAQQGLAGMFPEHAQAIFERDLATRMGGGTPGPSMPTDSYSLRAGGNPGWAKDASDPALAARVAGGQTSFTNADLGPAIRPGATPDLPPQAAPQAQAATQPRPPGPPDAALPGATPPLHALARQQLPQAAGGPMMGPNSRAGAAIETMQDVVNSTVIPAGTELARTMQSLQSISDPIERTRVAYDLILRNPIPR